MDTRKLGLKHVGEEIAIKDFDSDNHDVVGAIFLTGDEEFDTQDRTELADSIVKRFNRYPLLVAFIQQAGKIADASELQDFIANNYEAVMENKDGETIDDEVDFLNNPDIFEE